MKYLIIRKTKNGYEINAEVNGLATKKVLYIFHSQQEAEHRYRQEFGLKRKHFTRIFI